MKHRINNSFDILKHRSLYGVEDFYNKEFDNNSNDNIEDDKNEENYNFNEDNKNNKLQRNYSLQTYRPY